MGWPRRVAVLGVVLGSFAGVVRAHEVAGTRFDAPIPLPFLFAGAGATVALTALWLGSRPPAVAGSRRRLSTIRPRTARGIRAVARVAFFALALAALVHGLVGKQIPAENVATVFVWPVWIKGVGLIAVLAGSPWRVLSPWETLYDLLVRIEGREIALVGDYPSILGRWPAVAGFVLAVGIVENLTVVPRSPRTTGLLLAAYTLLMLLGGVAFGRSWFRRADAFAVLYRLLGRVAPLRVARTEAGGYEISVRPPWNGCTGALADRSLVAFAIAVVYTVSFDGFTNTPEFQTLLFGARELLGTGSGTGTLLYLLGLGGFVASFLLASVVVEWLGADEPRAWLSAARAFAPTVLPIAAAYEIAHNYPFVVRNLGQLATIGLELAISYHGPAITPLAWLDLPAFWASQVVLIVGGHVIAVVAAHLVAVDRYSTLAAARRGHLPLVVLMVGYTVLSLWIVSRPIVS